MLLSEIFNAYTIPCSQEIDISDLIWDSREAKPGALFFCMTGAKADGHDHAYQAYQRGTRYFVVNRRLDLPNDTLQIVVDNPRKMLASATGFYGHPSDKLKIIGVTGTKGKSTISCLLKEILCKEGIKTGYIGTNGIEYGTTKKKTVNTTPESHLIQKTLREMVDDGVKAVVMEVSSQGLMTHRVDGIRFETGVFTNISPDHIGPYEHANFEEYFNSKKLLFKKCNYGIINGDDIRSQEIISAADCPVSTFGIRNPASITASHIENWRSPSSLGVKFTCALRTQHYSVKLCQPGIFSVYNALAVLSVCDSLGLDSKKAAEHLQTVTVKGRAQIVPFRPGITVVIDYAHNQTSMENILTALRAYKPKRLICLFGSVGSRTKIRRIQLGQTASRLADFCVVTSDNPDFEDPKQIISDILTGFHSHQSGYIAIADRKKAIEYALKNAKSGDIILLAGKGHEDYQLIQGIRHPFSEEAIIKAFECENLLKTY